MREKSVKHIGIKLPQSDFDKLEALRAGRTISYTIRQLIRDQDLNLSLIHISEPTRPY